MLGHVYSCQSTRGGTLWGSFPLSKGMLDLSGKVPSSRLGVSWSFLWQPLLRTCACPERSACSGITHPSSFKSSTSSGQPTLDPNSSFCPTVVKPFSITSLSVTFWTESRSLTHDNIFTVLVSRPQATLAVSASNI